MNGKFFRWAIPLLLLFGGIAFASIIQSGGALNGSVTVGSAPQGGVSVTLLQNKHRVTATQTNARGAFGFRGLHAGYYDVSASFRGMTALQPQVLVPENGTVHVNLRLNEAEVDEDSVSVVTEEMPVEVADAEKNELRADKRNALSQRAAGAPAPCAGKTIAFKDRESYNKPQYLNPSTESYNKDPENDFKLTAASPLSTLSVDVDRASYANVRRFINNGQKPPEDAVRTEELINYFDYNYPQPTGSDPIAISTELTMCPWNPKHRLLHIGLQAKKISTEKLPASNLVFLIDVSGSMDEANKLPLVKASLRMLVNNLRAQDHVAIVVYAGNAGLVLPSTSGADKARILDALDQLSAGGSTAGGEGIELAYQTALSNFISGGNNRVILATDGDFNVGLSNNNELETLIVKERDKGVFLTVLGYGMGNYKDDKMEILADKGNGNHAYIDNAQEAQKTLVHEFGGTLFTVAKDVKAQIEFNPAKVQGYRLVGYENRLLNAEDFKDDKKDAAEMGSGHSVTILYELVPAGVKDDNIRSVDPLKYRQPAPHDYDAGGELATIKFRYKQPDATQSKELVRAIAAGITPINATSDNIRFSASVALFGMLLKDSKYKATGNWSTVLALAESARGADKEGYRAEFIRLVKSARDNGWARE